MKVNQTVLVHNCYYFLKHVESIINSIDKNSRVTIDLERESYTIDMDTTIYDRLYIIGRCWLKTKSKIKIDSNDKDKVFINFSEVKQATVLGATESIVNILKDKNKSNNVKFFEIKMISSVINKNKKY